MSILSTQLQDGLFVTSVAGQFEKTDAEIWLDALQHYADLSGGSLVALINAADVTFITSSARMLIAEATRLWGVKAILFVTQEPTMMQTIRVIEMLGEHGRIFAFGTHDEALAFAAQSLNPVAA